MVVDPEVLILSMLSGNLDDADLRARAELGNDRFGEPVLDDSVGEGIAKEDAMDTASTREELLVLALEESPSSGSSQYPL
jgi:hypothetical protein